MRASSALAPAEPLLPAELLVGRPVGAEHPRQREANREAAEELQISTRTVENYRARLNEKLDVRSRRELVAFALENRLIP